MSVNVVYSLDGVDFKDYGIYVSESSGIIDRPKLKKPFEIDWAECHGKVVDLDVIRVESREITLKCFVKASGKIDFLQKMNTFLHLFDAVGTRRLMIMIGDTPLVYEVYNEKGTSVNKRWSDNLMTGTFDLKLTEPEPVKMVIKHDTSIRMNFSYHFNCKEFITIYWGDGTKDYFDGSHIEGYYQGDHIYQQEGIYYIMIVGNIDALDGRWDDGTVIWNKL